MAVTESAFTIRELTGDKRLVELRGRAMPYRPYTLTGEQRLDMAWYQGSPEATLQLQGPKEEPTTIRGWWKDRFLQPIAALASVQPEELLGGIAPITEATRAGTQGSAPILVDGLRPVSVEDFAVNTIDDIRRKGQIVEVSFLSQTRRGILTRFVQNWHTSADLEYEIVFTWKDKGDSLVADIPLQIKNDDISASIDKLFDEIANLEGDGSFGIEFASTESAIALAQIDGVIDEIEDSTFSLESAFLSNVQTINGSVSTIQRTSGIYNFLKQRANELQNLFITEVESLSLNEESNFGERLSQRKDTRNRRQAAASILSVSAVKEQQLKKQINPELIATFIAKEGQDLRDVSAAFYDTPDEWRNLMRFNGLSTSKLIANQQIFVPRNPPSADRC